MPKFTKGPWKAEKDGSRVTVGEGKEKQSVVFLSVLRGFYYDQVRCTNKDGIPCIKITEKTEEGERRKKELLAEQQANASLISAAPEMYEALVSLENDDGNIPRGIWEKIQKSIAKAKGERECSGN